MFDMVRQLYVPAMCIGCECLIKRRLNQTQKAGKGLRTSTPERFFYHLVFAQRRALFEQRAELSIAEAVAQRGIDLVALLLLGVFQDRSELGQTRGGVARYPGCALITTPRERH